MTDAEECALGREAFERTVSEWRRKATPDFNTWSEHDREIYLRGWRDAIACALEDFEERWDRLQPEPPEKLN